MCRPTASSWYRAVSIPPEVPRLLTACLLSRSHRHRAVHATLPHFAPCFTGDASAHVSPCRELFLARGLRVGDAAKALCEAHNMEASAAEILRIMPVQVGGRLVAVLDVLEHPLRLHAV
jgi:hypothetical protein